MRRSRIVFILVLVLAGSGRVFVAMDVIERFAGNSVDAAGLRLGTPLLLIASALGAISQWWLRRDCYRFSQLIHQYARESRTGILRSTSRDLAPLTHAVNEL